MKRCPQVESPYAEQTPPVIIALVGVAPAALIRDGEAEFKALKKKKGDLSKTDIAKAIVAHPILLQRPVVVAGKRAAIGRPPEAVLPLLK